MCSSFLSFTRIVILLHVNDLRLRAVISHVLYFQLRSLFCKTLRPAEKKLLHHNSCGAVGRAHLSYKQTVPSSILGWSNDNIIIIFVRTRTRERRVALGTGSQLATPKFCHLFRRQISCLDMLESRTLAMILPTFSAPEIFQFLKHETPHFAFWGR